MPRLWQRVQVPNVFEESHEKEPFDDDAEKKRNK